MKSAKIFGIDMRDVNFSVFSYCDKLQGSEVTFS